MQRISNLVNPVIFTTAQKADDPGEDLRFAASILESEKVRWFISFGTALGFWRDKDFIQGDSDIDINILVDENTDPDRIIERFTKYYDLIRTVTEDGNLHQTAFQGKDKFIIDLCYFYWTPTGWQSYCEGGKWQDRKEVIGTPKPFMTKYCSVYIPERIEDYLKDRYGDWQTPKYGAITSSLKA